MEPNILSILSDQFGFPSKWSMIILKRLLATAAVASKSRSFDFNDHYEIIISYVGATDFSTITIPTIT